MKKNVGGEQLHLKSRTKSKVNKDLQKGFPATERYFSVLKYGSRWYIKQWITTNQLIAMNYKVQVKFVN